MQQVVVIHGSGPFAEIPRARLVEKLATYPVSLERLRKSADWKSNLPTALGPAYDALFPRMPNADDPRYSEWRAFFMRLLPLFKDALFVGHSLGGAFLMKFFSEERVSTPPKGLFTIAAPFFGRDSAWAQDGRLETSGFMISDDLSLVADQTQNIFLYHSTDDPIVPFGALENFTKRLSNATARVFKDRGHFLAAEFPEIVADIRELRKS